MKITFTDKTLIDNRPDLSDMEKITGGNINEIKEVVNANEDELDATKVKVENINTSLENFNKEVEALKENDTKQDEKIEYLEKEAVRLRQDIQASQLTGEAEGESIDLEDSSNARFNKFEIGGNHSQETREGYNLLENKATTQTQNGVTITKNTDGTLVVNGTATSSFTFLIASNIALKNGEKYRLSGCPAGGADKKYALTMNQYYENQSHYTQDYGSGSLFTYNELSANTNSVYIRVIKDVTYNNLIFKPMIIAGESTKEYEQYGATPSLEFPSEIKTVKDNVNVVVCNKNLFDKNNATVVEFFVDGENKIQSWASEVESIYISIKSNTTYTVSKKISSRFTVATSNKVPVAGVEVNAVSNRTASNLTITSRDGDKYLLIFYYKKSDDTLNAKEIRDSIQIEKGSTATDYEAHQEQAITMPVQQEMLKEDYFDWVKEKEVHKWTELIFDGTENWLQSGNIYPTFYISPDEIASKFGIPTGLKALCNYFTQKNNIWGIDEIGFDTANVRPDHVDFRFNLGSNSTITTLEAWKNKLVEMHNSGKPLVLYFRILNQNELDFSDEQKAVAKKIKETAHSYKGTTHIFSTDEISPIFDVVYAKDLNTVINNMQAQIINNASEEVNG